MMKFRRISSIIAEAIWKARVLACYRARFLPRQKRAHFPNRKIAREKGAHFRFCENREAIQRSDRICNLIVRMPAECQEIRALQGADELTTQPIFGSGGLVPALLAGRSPLPYKAPLWHYFHGNNVLEVSHLPLQIPGKMLRAASVQLQGIVE